MFLNSGQNIDCGYSLDPPLRGGSNEYPQSMFLCRYKKNNVYPCKSQFYYIQVGFKGVKITWRVFVMSYTWIYSSDLGGRSWTISPSVSIGLNVSVQTGKLQLKFAETTTKSLNSREPATWEHLRTKV